MQDIQRDSLTNNLRLDALSSDLGGLAGVGFGLKENWVPKQNDAALNITQLNNAIHDLDKLLANPNVKSQPGLLSALQACEKQIMSDQSNLKAGTQNLGAEALDLINQIKKDPHINLNQVVGANAFGLNESLSNALTYISNQVSEVQQSAKYNAVNMFDSALFKLKELIANPKVTAQPAILKDFVDCQTQVQKAQGILNTIISSKTAPAFATVQEFQAAIGQASVSFAIAADAYETVYNIAPPPLPLK